MDMSTPTPKKDYLAIEAARQSGVYYPRGIVLTRGAGTQVWDDQGRLYYDATSAYGITPLGHAHPGVAKALADQAGTLLACSNSFGNDQRSLYLEELAAVLPSPESRIFLCNSGTEANEAAIKFARLTTQKPGVIAFNRGFHGRTMGALSFTANPKYREPFEPLVPGAKFVSYNNLEAVDAAWDDTIGTVLVEIVQGEGGVHVASREFIQGLQARCVERGAMLIVDEVQTGFGRTGKMFACEHFGLKPDLLTLAKGIANGFPMGAVAIGPRIQALPVGAHGNTFGGSPLACAAARTTLQTLLREHLVEASAQKGERLLQGLRSISSRRVREVRGLGMIVAVELREKSAPYLHALQERGILSLFAGTTVLRFLPPLVSSDAEIDRIVQAAAEVLA